MYASETVAELTVQLASTHICVDRASARARMLHCVNVRNRNNGAHIMVSSSCREDTVQKRRNFQTILVVVWEFRTEFTRVALASSLPILRGVESN